MWQQIVAVTFMNLRSLPQRLTASGVAVIGVAGVVGVLVSVLAMATGLTQTFLDSGDPARALVLHKSANTEDFSNIEVGWVGAIEDAPGVARGANGKAAVTPERVVGASLHRRSEGSAAEITLRGTSAAGFIVHPEWHLVAGRTFRPGLREIVVGAGAAAEFQGLELGDRVQLADGDWTVVGRFTSNGDSHESEALTDVRTLMSAFGWSDYSSVTVRLESPAAFKRFKSALLANPSLEVDVIREQDYYREQSRGIAALLYLVSTIVGAIMAIGAVFTALNTMYSAVATRTTEIATLRALGFGAGGVVISVLTEAILLSLVGALLGAMVAWLLFNGDSLSTIGGQFGSQVRFKLLIQPRLIAVGVVWACAIGLIGGMLPAIRAARLPVAVALRPG
jgi:putative ABC transport system permease protein